MCNLNAELKYEYPLRITIVFVMDYIQLYTSKSDTDIEF